MSLIVFLVAAAVSLLATPLARRLAIRLGILDRPEARKIHREAMPLLGGLAVAAGFAAGCLLAAALAGSHGAPDTPMLGLAVGALLMVGLGVYDDARGADARLKLSVQAVAALVVIASGSRIGILTNPFGGTWDLGVLSVPVTLLWIIGITNAMNLIDGLDGLAAGIGAIVAATLFVAWMPDSTSFVPLAAIALAGAATGFLRWNFPPARIFLGDTGSLLLGFVIAVLGMQGSLKGTTALALVVPIIALGIPVADTALAILRRGRERRHLFQADREHLHHRLVRIGLTQRQAVLVLYWVSIFLAGTAIMLKNLSPQKGFLLVAMALAAGGLWLRSLIFVERRFDRLHDALARLAREGRAPDEEVMGLVNGFHVPAKPPASAAASPDADETCEAIPVSDLIGRPGTARKILEGRLRAREGAP